MQEAIADVLTKKALRAARRAGLPRLVLCGGVAAHSRLRALAVEREHRVTRGLIEVLARFNHPFSIITKSALIARDADVMGPMAEKGLVSAAVSITTKRTGASGTS